MDRDQMSNFYRGPPIDTYYQASFHLAKWFQRRRFFRKNQPIRNKNGHVSYRIRMKLALFTENPPHMLPTKSRFIWPSGFRGDFKKSTN